MSNVIQFIPKESPNGFVGVEIYKFSMLLPNEIWVALVGPKPSPGSSHVGRSPYHLVGTFVLDDDAASAMRVASDLACKLANKYQIEIIDLVGLGIVNEAEPENGPYAA